MAALGAGLLLAVFCQTTESAAQTMRMPDGRGGMVERRCEPAAGPKKLPAFDALVDSQSVAPYLPRDSAVLLSISFAENGTLRSIRVLEGAAARTDTLVHVLTTLARQQPSGPLWAVRVRLGGAERKVGIERSLYCPPMRDPAAPRERHHTAVIGPDSNAPPPPPLSGRQRVVAEVSLSDVGDVLDVKLISRSGIRDLDDGIVLDLQSTRYFPALLDGEALPSWIRTDGRTMRL